MFADIELKICVDCYMHWYDYETTEEHAAVFNEYVRPGDFISQAIDTEGEFIEPSFSWSPCDICGTTLGGDRFDVILSRPID